MDEKLTVVMVTMHTSPLAQPGQGDAGGLNVYVRNLSAALVRLGHQVLAFTRKTSTADVPVIVDQKTNSQVIPVPAGRLKLPKESLPEFTTQFSQAMLELLTERAQHRIVFHSHYWLSGIAAIEAGQRLQVPVVHTMHTLGAAKNALAPGSDPAHRVEREAYVAAKASVLTANTTVEKQELLDHTAVNERRVVVVHPGVDHKTFSPTGPAQWPGRDAEDGLKVLFAGRMQPFKGPHILVDALAVLRRRGHHVLPHVHFTGAVSGQHNYDVQARAYLLGIAQQCSFSAPVQPSTLAMYMRAADVVAVPSVAESFGLVAIEAQACGTPVMAHRAGGLTTAVSHQHSGALIDSLEPEAWADILESVISQPDRWYAYGQAGIEYTSQFSWTATAHKMLKIYSSL